MTLPLSPDVLRDTTAQLLEQAAFFFCTPMTEPVTWPERLLEARLRFEGPGKGAMRLRVTEPSGVELAANLLGTEPDDAEAASHSRAAVGELLNMLCGAVLEQWVGTRQVCRLGVPEVREVAAEAWAGPPTCRAALIADERHRLEVDLLVEEDSE